MNIYFVSAIAAAEKYGPAYKKIVSFLAEFSPNVVSEHILSTSISDIKKQTVEEYRDYYSRKFLKSMKTADIVVAEVSFPSTINVGHEITRAIDFEKPVLALYSKGNSPMFLEGLQSDKFILAEYDLNDLDSLQKIVKSNIKKLLKNRDIRFNFFISPEIVRYLDWVAKVKRVPRSVYLRDLIEDDMKKHKDYGNQG